MTQKKSQIFEFEGFELAPAERLLARNGEPISLQPKAFSALVFLVENHGHLVEKSELIDHVWEDTFVEEAAVSRCIWQIRTALGIDSKDQKFIQTVPKRGYRFVAKVKVNSGIENAGLVEVKGSDSRPSPVHGPVLPVTRSVAHAASTLAIAAEPVRNTVRPFPVHEEQNGSEPRKGLHPVIVRRVTQTLSPYVIASVVGVVAIVAAIGIYLLFQPNEIRSVAVMPFVNETGDPQFEYLSDGMTDTLISSLAELPNIKVKAKTSVFRYKEQAIDPKVIGKELGVQAIVNGSVTQRDGRTHVVLEVVDTQTEDVIFSAKYDKSQSELVTLQSDIARDVSAKLKGKLSGAEEAKVTKTHTADPEALRLYLQGQFYAHKGGRSNVQLATDYFNKAIEKDPNYALAHAGLALNYRSYFLYNLVADRPRARAAATSALELDDSLAEAHLAAGDFRRAIELNPDYAEAHVAFCIDLTMTRQFEEGIAECRKANELAPSSAVVAMHLGVAYLFARRLDEAIEVLTNAHQIDPTFMGSLGHLGAAQTLKGQYIEAVATFRKTIEISDGSPNAKGHLAYALAKVGQRDEALKLIDELKLQAEREHINTFHFVMPYIGLGDKDEAFFWLGRGIDDGSIGFRMLDVHPWFDELRSDPRFQALLKRANRQP